jgi:HK97 family phage portal protein
MIFRSLLDMRASDTGLSTLAQPAGWMLDAFGLVPSEAGVLVSERNSVGLSAVWTAVNIRAGLIASLPFNVLAPTPTGGRKLARNRKEFSILHDRCSPEDTSYYLRHKMAVSWLLWGNAYAQIEWDGRGALRYLWPYHPQHVHVVYGKTRGEYYYVVTGMGPDGMAVQQKVLPENMIHLRGFTYEGVQGISVIQNYRRGLGIAIATEVFASKFYQHGAKASGVLTYPGRMSDQARNNFQRSFDEKYAGAHNSNKTIVLEEGAKYQQLTIPPNDAQFIETRRLSRAEIAGLFRLPTMLVPGSDDKAPTYSSSEIFNRQLVDFTLRDDVTMIEQEFNSKLFPGGDHVVGLDLRDLLRADSVARADYWLKRWQMGSISADEVREDEDENPVPGGYGKKFYVPVNYIAVDAPNQPGATATPGKEEFDPTNPNPDQSEPDPNKTEPNPKPKPKKNGAVGAGFKVLLTNLVSELKGWESFSPKRASAKLRGLVIDPLAAELLTDVGDSEKAFLASCADALALRVRTLELTDVDAELARLVAQISASTEI